MAVFRIEKTRDYTVMSNHHLRNTNLSLKAKGLLSLTVILFLVVSIALTAILLSLVHPIVVAMSTPADAVSGTVTYLTICFIGIPFITSYNIIKLHITVVKEAEPVTSQL